LQLVFHPGLKLEYFCQQDWEDEWIDVAENLVCKEYIDAYENQTVLGEDSLVNDAEVCSPFFMICLHDARCSVQDSDDGLVASAIYQLARRHLGIMNLTSI